MNNIYTEAYKNSGIDWIGNIPKEWLIKKVKNAFLRKKDTCNVEDPIILSLTNKGVKIRDISNNEGQIAESYFNYNPVERGDLLLNPMDLVSNAFSAVSDVEGVISPAYINLKTKEGYYSKYYDYYFKLQYWGMAFFAHGKGVSFDNRWTLNNETLMNYFIPVPEFQEQKNIADYLDKKCNEIDEVIETEKSIIEKLKEYRQSIITETVTKGLDKYISLKDSGIEWIGKIPQHWDLKRLKNVLNERNEKNIPIQTTERLSLSIGLGVTLYSEKTTNLDRFKDDFTQYKLARENDLVMNSMNVIVGAVGLSKYFGCVSPAYYVFYSSDSNKYLTKYFEYVFLTSTIRKVLFSLGKGIMAIERGNDRVNTCRLKVSNYDIKNLYLPIPPYKEQEKIINYLDEKCSEIDKAISDKEKVIEKFTEYKKSLIYEYVTGKKRIVV